MVWPQTAYGLSADWLIDRGFIAQSWAVVFDSRRCFFYIEVLQTYVSALNFLFLWKKKTFETEKEKAGLLLQKKDKKHHTRDLTLNKPARLTAVGFPNEPS